MHDYYNMPVYNSLANMHDYSIIELLLTHKDIQYYFNEIVYPKNPLLYACVHRDFDEIEKILATDTNLMNEDILLVILSICFFIILLFIVFFRLLFMLLVVLMIQRC